MNLIISWFRKSRKKSHLKNNKCWTEKLKRETDSNKLWFRMKKINVDLEMKPKEKDLRYFYLYSGYQSSGRIC